MSSSLWILYSNLRSSFAKARWYLVLQNGKVQLSLIICQTESSSGIYLLTAGFPFIIWPGVWPSVTILGMITSLSFFLRLYPDLPDLPECLDLVETSSSFLVFGLLVPPLDFYDCLDLCDNEDESPA